MPGHSTPMRVGRRNSTFQVLQALKTNRGKRSEMRELFIEGIASIKAADRAGRAFRRLVYSDGSQLSGWATEMLRKHVGCQLIALAHPLFQELCDKVDPGELVVTIEKEDLHLGQGKVPERPFVVVVDRPTNHGNLGSIIRTANAFGVDLLVTLGHGVDLYDPAVIRASMGGIFHSQVCHEPSITTLLRWLEQLKTAQPELRVVGTDSDAQESLWDAPALLPPIVLLIGNEARGLSVELKRRADAMIRVPMTGEVDSLNVACAASIVLYEAVRQRGTVRPLGPIPEGPG